MAQNNPLQNRPQTPSPKNDAFKKEQPNTEPNKPGSDNENPARQTREESGVDELLPDSENDAGNAESDGMKGNKTPEDAAKIQPLR